MAANGSRASIMLVDQVLVTLTKCVITFSEPEEILTDLETQKTMNTIDLSKWVRKKTQNCWTYIVAAES